MAPTDDGRAPAAILDWVRADGVVDAALVGDLLGVPEAAVGSWSLWEGEHGEARARSQATMREAQHGRES